MAPIILHGTCVALGKSGALLRGAPGAGKSDLALRFIFLPPTRLLAPPALIADDRVELRRAHGKILASCPQRLAGKIEVRGVGVVHVEMVEAEAELKLLVDLAGFEDIPRLPDMLPGEDVLGLPVPRLTLDPFEPSAPLKLAIAIQKAASDTVD